MKDKPEHCQPENSEINGIVLSNREKLILKFLALGENNKQIAERLFLSEHTVKADISSVFKKLGVQNRTHAAYLAAIHNLLE